jgi:two-component system phosphate regulon sensor histidine kinase PhoR
MRERGCDRECEPRHAGDFPPVLLGIAGHDLRQPLQVVRGTYDWLSRRLDTDAKRVRLRLGEQAIAKLSHQLDRLVEALRLYECTTAMELSPVPLAPLFESVRTEDIELIRRSRPFSRCRGYVPK